MSKFLKGDLVTVTHYNETLDTENWKVYSSVRSDKVSLPVIGKIFRIKQVYIDNLTDPGYQEWLGEYYTLEDELNQLGYKHSRSDGAGYWFHESELELVFSL